MKLYNPAIRIMVDFYPIKAGYNEPVVKGKFLKVVDLDGMTSKRVVTQREMNNEIRERLNNDYAVVDFNTEAEVHNPLWGAC